ncbi:MAG: hypothetical protein WCJ29_03915 [bacterium]
MENDIISQKYSDLSGSKPVLRAAIRKQAETGEAVTEDKLVQNYFDRISRLLNPKNPDGSLDEERRDFNIAALRDSLHEKFVIKTEEIPESYWKYQIEALRERGEIDDYKDVPEKVKQETKQRLAEIVVEDQRRSLDVWINYLVSSEAAYPDWFKYYVIREVLQTGSYDIVTNQYSGRKPGKPTTAPFPELNSQALAIVLDRINAGNQQEKERTKGYKFPILYAETLRSLVPLDEKQLKETRGVWKTYKKGSGETKLTKTLKGFNTNLCIAGDATAKSYLSDGDLTIYYSMDSEGTARIPRAALHVVSGNLKEVRGIGANQNTDPYISDVLAKKLKKYPNGEKYAKQSADMKQVTAIERKINKKEQLSKDDLAFLYEIDEPIQGFGNNNDPRVSKLREMRNPKEDMLIVFNDCRPDQIATSEHEVKPDTRVYIGPLFPGIFKLNIEKIFTRFPEAKIRRSSLEIGDKTKEEYISALKKAGIEITHWAKRLLDSKNFTTKKSTGSFIDRFRKKKSELETLDIVRLTVADLGFAQGATAKEIYERAETFNLEICPAEVGLAQRLFDARQISDDQYRIAMKPASDSVLGVFRVGRNSRGQYLDVVHSSADHKYSADSRWIFRCSK